MIGTNRTERVFGMTLTEVIIMILFLFLLVSESVIGLLSDENDKLNAIPTLAALTTAERDSLANLARVNEVIQTLQDSLESQESRIAVLDALIREEPDDERLATMLEYTEKKIQEYQLRSREIDSNKIDSMLANIGSELMQCQSDMQYCYDRLGDFPPCWTKDGRPEYIFDVTLRPNSLLLKPIWPPTRNEAANSTPGVMGLSGLMSNSAFRLDAARVLDWSNNQPTPCRHFVTINDSTVSKQEYKDQLRIVEGYFYKYLTDR